MVARQRSFGSAAELVEVVEPRVRPLDHPAVAVEVGIVQRWSSEFAAMGELPLGNTGTNASSLECPTQGAAVVAFISSQPLWSSARAHANPVNGRQSPLRVMHIRGREGQRQRQAGPIRHAVTLRPNVLQFGRPADTAPPFLAGISAASRAAWSQSRIPRRSRITRSLAQIRCQVPSRCQRLSRRQQVVPDPYRTGTSFHGTPLVTTYQIPSRIWRSVSRAGRPGRFFRGFFGSKGAKTRHSLSVNRRMVPSLLFGENHTMTEGITQ